VLTLDAKQQRVGFTIKASAFTAEEREAMNAGESESGEEEEEAAERKEEEEAVATPAAAVALPPSALPAVGFFEEEEKEKENSSSASSSSSSEEEDKKSTRKRERSATAAEVEARESQLARREAVPETDEDFERLLMGAPHSSEVWIRFMSHKLSNADVEAARQIGTRALLRIPSSSHAKERANVWTALTNLEVKFGSDKTLESILARGGSEVGRLEMDCRALDALEREGDKKLEIATEFSAAVLKRHAAAAEAWLRVGQFFIRRGDGAKSGQLLQKGLKQVADKVPTHFFCFFFF
jgi:rRNA biogenesis protein RRP5